MTNTTSHNEVIEVGRAIHELRSRRPVIVHDAEGAALTAWPAEDFIQDTSVTRQAGLYIVITAARAGRLGRKSFQALKLPFTPHTDIHLIKEIILPEVRTISAPAKALLDSAVAADELELAALQILKHASLLPAALAIHHKASDLKALQSYAQEKDYLSVCIENIRAYQAIQSTTLKIVGKARLPLKAAENAHIMAFRPQGSMIEHLAIIIGQPETEASPLVRVHSSCLTGDILGSLRCDCGAQLQGAIAQIAQAGHGIVLYLNQEGRGIGIANKLRAYALQDAGLDTLDANEQLGFDGDERHFRPAAEMLKMLGIESINMLTNNPDKMRALMHYGIEVKERLPLVISAGKHNSDYLTTKSKRCGHIF